MIHNGRGISRRRWLRSVMMGGPAALAGLSAAVSCGRGPSKPRPNIILILIDALRADRLGVYGHTGRCSPAIDAFAAQGTVCERTLAQAPWTQPSMATLFSSCYPSVHKVLDYGLTRSMKKGRTNKMAVFGDGFSTLAEVLQRHGYDTAGFITNFVLSSVYGFSQGFAHYVDMPSRRKTGGDMPGGVLNEEVTAWLQARRDPRPFFLYLHYMDVHGPYYARPAFYEPRFAALSERADKRPLSTEEWRGIGYLAKRQAAPILARYPELSRYREFWSEFYNAGVREMDRIFQDLSRELTRMGVWEDAYVILTSDHGEAFLEHGYWNHGHGLHQHQLHVPLILRWPGRLKPGRRVPAAVRLVDLMPTVLDQLGLPAPREMQGRSLVKEFGGRSAAPPPPSLGEGVKNHALERSLVFGNWKLIVDPEREFKALYRLDRDPGERRNLCEEAPRIAADLENRLRRQIAVNQRLAARVTSRDVTLTSDEEDRLRSLGYL